MATIPIRDVPGDPVEPSGDELILIDNGIAMQKATINDAVKPKATEIVDQKISGLNLGTASQNNTEDFATAAQGAKADTAVQPEDLADVATSGDYDDLSNRPTLGTAASRNVGTGSGDVAAGNRGLPAGGDPGQVLIKNTGDDYDTYWETVAAATAVSYAPQMLSGPQQTQAQANLSLLRFDTVADLLADETLSYTPGSGLIEVGEGDIIEAQGFRYEVAASGATDADVETAGGVRLKVPDDIPEAFVEMFGEDEAAYLRAMRTKKLFRCIGTQNTVTIYCDPVNGDDGNLGTIDAPLRTFTEAAARLPRYYENVLIMIDLYNAHQAPVFYDEDIFIPGIIGSAVGNEPRTSGVRIYGNPSNIHDVKVGSLVLAGCRGLIVIDTRYFAFTREAPWPADVNESAAFQVIGCDEVFTSSLAFDPETSIRIGMVAYNSQVEARHWEAGNIDHALIHAKRGSRVQASQFTGEFNPVADAWSSYVGGGPFAATENDSLVQYYIGNGNAMTTGPNSRGLYQCRGKNGGQVEITTVNDAYVVSSGAWKEFDSAVVAYRGSNQTVARGDWQIVAFDTIVKDDRNRLQPTGRYYFVSSIERGTFRLSGAISVRASDFSDGQALRARIVTDVGVIDEILYEKGPAGNDPITLHVEALLVMGEDVNIGQWVAIQFSGAGSGDTLIYGGRHRTKFEMSRVG